MLDGARRRGCCCRLKPDHQYRGLEHCRPSERIEDDPRSAKRRHCRSSECAEDDLRYVKRKVQLPELGSDVVQGLLAGTRRFYVALMKLVEGAVVVEAPLTSNVRRSMHRAANMLID